MSYKERQHKCLLEKSTLLRSKKWANMTPKERDIAIRNLENKWKV